MSVIDLYLKKFFSQLIMIKNLRLEKVKNNISKSKKYFQTNKEISSNTIENIKIFRLKKEIDNTSVKEIINLFKLKKEKNN